MAVIVEARFAHADFDGAKGGRIAIEAGVPGHILVHAPPQGGQGVRPMVESLGPGSVTGEAHHEATHVPIALSRWLVRHFGVRFQATDNADLMPHEGFEHLRRRKPTARLGRCPQVRPTFGGLLATVGGMPGGAVGPVEHPEEGFVILAIGPGAIKLEHGFERGQGEAYGDATGHTPEKAPAREVSIAQHHGSTSSAPGGATVLNPSLLAK